MRPVRRFVAVVVGLALLAGCSAFGAPKSQVAAPAPPAPGPQTVFRVVDLTPAQVHRISVESHGRQAALVRSTAGTWLPEPGTPDTAVSLMAEREEEILPLQAFRRLDADPNRPDFGLAAPELVVRIEDAGGTEAVVSVGVPTFSGAGSYARRQDDPAHVYLLVRRSVDDLRSLFEGQRVNSPRSEQEVKVIEETEQTQDADPENVSNPWLTQALEEAHR
jgi:hypothetical protein